MLIKYNNTNLHALSTYDGKVLKWLKPGWNEFPSDLWAVHAKDAEIVSMIKAGKIELMQDHPMEVKQGKKVVEKVFGKGDQPLDLTKLPESEAIKVALETYDRPMLERWMDEETRHKVKRAIDKRLKPLLPGASASDEDEE